MKKYLLLVSSIFTFFSCTNKAYIADKDFEARYIPFVQDNTISREEIILKFGQPAWIFEDGRIFTYRLVLDRKGNVTPIRVSPVLGENDISQYTVNYTKQYSLVLVFDDKNILEKHSLIRVNP